MADIPSGSRGKKHHVVYFIFSELKYTNVSLKKVLMGNKSERNFNVLIKLFVNILTFFKKINKKLMSFNNCVVQPLHPQGASRLLKSVN